MDFSFVSEAEHHSRKRSFTMERDMDLVKEILAQLRDGNYHVEEEIEAHSEEEIIYHLKIMEENNLVDVELKEIAHTEEPRKRTWSVGKIGLTWRDTSSSTPPKTPLRGRRRWSSFKSREAMSRSLFSRRL